EGLTLRTRISALVCGDTTPHSKPHPAPLLEAARQLGLQAAQCVYVGDDLRDVLAGHAAGMATLVASWGYLGDGPPLQEWGADAILGTPADLLNWLDVA
ncbi:MAG TPA: HAD-IA family hydrolase, partial [Burkholderiaceae bacterium]